MDPRHDGWTFLPMFSVNYMIDTACPDNVVVESTLYVGDFSRPLANETYGETVCVMKAVGAPPAGRPNWNGTTVTEQVDAAETPDNPANFVVSLVSGTGSGSTFTFGTSTHSSVPDDRFDDDHESIAPLIVLSPTVMVATSTRNQRYWCSSTESYPFVITRTYTKTLAPGVRVDVTK